MRDTVAKVNSYMRLLQIMAANAAIIPDGFSVEWYGINIWVYDSYDDNGEKIEGTAKTAMANIVRTLRRFTNGTVEKGADDYYFWVDIHIPNEERMKIRISSARNAVCTKKVIGTVEVEEIDYSAAPKKTITKDVIEWDCGSLLEGVTQ